MPDPKKRWSEPLVVALKHAKWRPHFIELILGMSPANGKRRYFVTKSLIGWV